MATTVLTFSGGLSSTALLYELRDRGDRVHCLFVDYGQAQAAQELAAAHKIFTMAARKRRIGQEISLNCITIPGPTITNPTHGPPVRREFEDYGHLVLVHGEAAGEREHAKTLACGVRIDRCVQHWDRCFANLLSLKSWDMAYYAPFIERDAAWVIAHGDQLGAPLVETWSCLDAGKKHCGTCRGCIARKSGFEGACVPDFTAYTVGADVLPLPQRKRELKRA